MPRLWPLWWVCVGCSSPEPEPPADTSDDPEDVVPGEPELQTTIAVIADPHVTSEGEHARRLEAALAHIDAQADARDISLTLVCGDVAWGAGLDTIVDLLSSATVPVVPIIGDNEIQVGDEQAYHDAMQTLRDGLDATLGAWRQGPAPIFNDEIGADSWFDNFAFEHEGLTIIGVDWAARVVDPILGEFADLHRVDGGTWDWLSGELEALPSGLDERVVLLTHHPMMWLPGGFHADEAEAITTLMAPYADDVYAAFGGHLHFDLEDEVPDAGYEVYLTDATWDDAVTVRLVEVWSDGVSFSYVHDLIEVPF